MQIRWELFVAFVTAGALTVASVIVFATLIARRTKASWKYWLYGAVVFIVFQGVLRLPWLIPLNILLRDVLRSSAVALVGFTAFAALTAALFERGGQWFLFRKFVRPEERTAANALMIGAGHGGIEAFFIGLLLALQGVNYLLLFALPPELFKSQKQVFAQLAWWLPFMGMWERLSTQVFQIAATVLVWHSFRFGAKWFWLAIAAHFGADFIFPLLHRHARQWLGTDFGSLVTEVGITIYAAVWAYVAWQCLKVANSLHEGEGISDEHPAENP